MYYLSSFSEKEEKKFRVAVKPTLRDVSRSALAGSIAGGILGTGLETMKAIPKIREIAKQKPTVMQVVNPDGQKYSFIQDTPDGAIKQLRKNFRKGVLQKAAIGAGALGGISLAGGLWLSNSKKARQSTDVAIRNKFNKRITKPANKIAKEATKTNKELLRLRDYGEY